jgi:mannose-6-phosphate isomerase-like protein (cupin superfamily)
MAPTPASLLPSDFRLPLPKVRGPVRATDVNAFPRAVHHSEFVAAPNSGVDAAILVVSRLPPRVEGPPLHTHSCDQFYYVVKGELNLQLGVDSFKLTPNTLVRIPPGTPHHNWNDSAEEELHIEVFVPPPPDDDKLALHAQPQKIADTAALLVPAASRPIVTDSTKGFTSRTLMDRITGSRHMSVHVTEIAPGGGEPDLHMQTFDKIYFILEGTLHVQIGLKSYQAQPHSYVIVPAGTVHRIWNEAPNLERHVSFHLPEPQADEACDVSVRIGAPIGNATGH